MIKVLEYVADEEDKARAILFADTKEEVPETGTLTEAEGKTKPFTAPSMVITAKLEIGVLKSTDAWEWGE